MVMAINEDCINCDVCALECPNEAISAGDEIYLVDPKRCTECSDLFAEPQCIEVCPVDAIVPVVA